MFLLIVIVILIASASILWNIYMWIFSLQQNYGDINSYYSSYYGAISSIERWLLVTKYKQPSFVGSGWFIWDNNRWEISEIFSWDFGKFTEWSNWLVWEINSYCEHITGTLRNNNVLIINSKAYWYTNTGHYETDTSSRTRSFSAYLKLTWNITNIYNNTILNNGNVYRQLDEAYYSWFVISTWNTMINYYDIINSWYIDINSSTTDPSNIAPIWDTLCTQDWCFVWQTINDLINPDKWILFYIKERFLDNNSWQIGQLNYDFNISLPSSPWDNTHTNCQFYYINWNWNIWNYKNTLQIKKPAFNYKNPYRQNFIFPYYN